MAMWAPRRRDELEAAPTSPPRSTFAHFPAHTAHIQLLMIFGFPLIQRRSPRQPARWRQAPVGHRAQKLTAPRATAAAGGLIGVAVIIKRGGHWAAIGIAVVVRRGSLPVPCRICSAPMWPAAPPSTNCVYSANVQDYLTTGIAGEAAGGRRAQASRDANWVHRQEVLFPSTVITLFGLSACSQPASRADRRGCWLRADAILAAWASLGRMARSMSS